MEPEFYIVDGKNGGTGEKRKTQSPNKNTNRPKESVFVLVLLTAVVIIAVYASAKQLVQGLKTPFLLNINGSNINSSDISNEVSNQSNAVVDRLKDTDGDGLTDYDEINIYHTSPYLADTDSDGIPDGTEVANNTDPNCPKGQICGSAANLSDTTATSTSLGQLTPEDLATLDPAQLRQILIDKGVSADEVNKLDDQTLRKTFADTLNGVKPEEEYINWLKQIGGSPSQIRQILSDQGMDKAEIDKLSDQDLTNLWLQLIKEEQQTASSTILKPQ